MGTAIAEEWRKHFVAYEDALASFYSLQDATQLTLDDSFAIACRLDGLMRLRAPVLAARRQLRLSADDGRVVEVERGCATIEIDGVPFDVMDLVGNRSMRDDTLLEIGFRVDPHVMPHFVNLTEPVRIRFPFGESTFVAACRLVHFKLDRHEFEFRFATVDPV